MAMLDVALEYLTPTEASVVSDVAVRDVNRVMDEHIIPETFFVRGEKRKVRAAACPLIHFYFHTADYLTSEMRSHAIDVVVKRREFEKTFVYWLLLETKTSTKESLVEAKEWAHALNNVAIEKVLTLNFDLFFAETTKRYSALIEAKERVVEDAEILSGTPVIRGTRVPVYDVAASVRKGISRDRIRAAYPSIDDYAIDLAVIYADATPARGRPKEVASRVEAKDVRRVPRRPKK